MTTRYSKKIIEKVIVEGDEIRKYQTPKLASYEVSLEGMKVARVLMPSVGSMVDSFINGSSEDDLGETVTQTFSGAMFFMSENLQDEHYLMLVDKLLGSLLVNGKSVEDWSDHFDEYPQDFLEVLYWVARETFESFFMESTMLAPLKTKMVEMVQLLKGKLKEDKKYSAIESNER